MSDASTGMTISLPGVLIRAARIVGNSDESSGLDHSLLLLLKHLRVVRSQPRRIREFFELWADEGQEIPGEDQE